MIVTVPKPVYLLEQDSVCSMGAPALFYKLLFCTQVGPMRNINRELLARYRIRNTSLGQTVDLLEGDEGFHPAKRKNLHKVCY